jgi:predicted ester cyclase
LSCAGAIAAKGRSYRWKYIYPGDIDSVQNLLEDGDAIAVAWLWSATHRGAVAGFAASGKTIRMSGATIYYFDADDRIGGHWQISDRLGVFQQLSAAQSSV